MADAEITANASGGDISAPVCAMAVTQQPPWGGLYAVSRSAQRTRVALESAIRSQARRTDGPS